MNYPVDFHFRSNSRKLAFFFSLRNHHRISIRKLSKNFRFRVFESRKNHFVKCFFETDFALFENFFRNRVSMKISVFEFHFFVKSFFLFLEHHRSTITYYHEYHDMLHVFSYSFREELYFFLYGKKFRKKRFYMEIDGTIFRFENFSNCNFVISSLFSNLSLLTKI